MQQFLVVAYDYTDSEALERRMKARQAHLQSARELKAKGNLIEGGAILNEDGKMIGSTLLMVFANRDELDACLQTDPYVVGKVWEKVEVQFVKLVKF